MVGPPPGSFLEPSAPRTLPTVAIPANDQGPARRHWTALTVTVAWELARALPRVRPQLLQLAREHAAWRLPDGASLADTELVAAQATREFLERRAGRYRRWADDPDLDVLPDPRWRQAVLDTATPLHEAVFRLHYADGVPLEELAPRLKVDLTWLRPAREAVRELVRVIVAEDGVSTEGWDVERVDRFVTRVALAAGDRCPGPGGLGTETGRAHGESCPRCGRALRLIREGVLAPNDLFAPDGPVPPPNTTLTLIQVQADARKAARPLHKRLAGAVRLGDDVLVLPLDAEQEAALRELAEAGTPARTQLRIAKMSVPGRLAEGLLVGRAPEALQDAVQLLPWGEVRGLDALPEPLPPPPSAARWWATAGLVASLAVAAGAYAMVASRPEGTPELSGTREVDAVVFDTNDEAYVDVIAIGPDRAELLFHSTSPADKAALATTDGRYRTPADARPVVIVSAGTALPDTELVATSARDAADARARLRAAHPDAAVLVVR